MSPGARTAALAIALVSAGCVGLLGPEPAPLPPQGSLFTVTTEGCGLQATPHESLWITYPNASLYHLTVAVQTDGDGTEDGRRDDVHVPFGHAFTMLSQANATGAFDLPFYLRASKANGFERFDLWHAEHQRLSDEAFEQLRLQVTRSDLASMEPNHTEPHHVADGCGFHHAAWTNGTYPHVYATSMNGPDELTAFRELHHRLHPRG